MDYFPARVVLLCTLSVFAALSEDVCRSFRCHELASSLMYHMDGSADPCDDFDQYACGGYKRRAPYNPEMYNMRYTASLWDTAEKLDVMLADVLNRDVEEMTAEFKKSEWKTKMVSYYKSCLRTMSRQRPFQIINSIYKYLNVSRGYVDPLIEMLARANVAGVPILFNIKPVINNTMVSFDFSNAMMLTEKKYILYSMRNPIFVKKKIITMAPAYRPVDLSTMSGRVANISIKVIKILNNRNELQDNFTSLNNSNSSKQLYDNTTNTVFEELVGEYFHAYSEELGITLFNTNSQLQALIERLRNEQFLIMRLFDIYSDDPEAFRTWLFIIFVVQNPDVRSFMWRNERSYLKLNGDTRREVSTWKKCLSILKVEMSPAILALTASESVGTSGKQDLKSIMRNIKDAFMERVGESKVFSSEAVKVAKLKIDALSSVIAYKDILGKGCMFDDILAKWNVSYDQDFYKNQLDLRVASYGNIVRGLLQRRDEYRQIVSLLREKYTRYLQVNAFYMAKDNKVQILMGVAQPPRFHADYPKYAQYGGTGSIIGHEIVHGFDSKFFLNTLANLPQDLKIFLDKVRCLDQYYRTHFKLPYVRNQTNRCTLQDDVSDLGGINIAMAAYHNWKMLQNHGNHEPTLPGFERFSNDQLYYLRYAQNWCEKGNANGFRQIIERGVRCPYGHSLGRHRILGPLQNSDGFAKAFKCPAGTKMNPVKKCRVW